MDKPERKSFRDLKRNHGLGYLAAAMFIIALGVALFLLIVLAIASVLLDVILS